MRSFLFLAVLGSVLIAACSTGRKTATKTLVGRDPGLNVVVDSVLMPDTLSKIELSVANPHVSEDSEILPHFPAALTPEEKLAELKRAGVYKQANWASAAHYDLRKPNFVIIHHTSQSSIAQTIRTFQLDHTKVSAHYVIGRNGQVVQMLNDYERAWHAGKAKWGNVTDINSISIGIELDNNGREPFPEEQINSLLVLLDTLKAKHGIPQLNFIGHADVAPTRKDDPSVLFPWKTLAEKGFGIWYNEAYLLEPPFTFNPMDALKIMGYDLSNPEAAIRAFKRKFIIKEVNAILTPYDKSVLYDLYRKYY